MHRHPPFLIVLFLTILVTCAIVHAAERCNRCSREIGQEWRFCAYCGVRIEPLPPTERPWESPGTRAGQEIIGPDGGPMVWVPPGEFMMGSDDPNHRARPVHSVCLTRGFWLGKFEVTRAQHRRFCERTGRPFPDERPDWDEHPARYVNWHDAVAYCDHYGLHLPTEAQWEFAARGPQSWWYPWGFEWDSASLNYTEHRDPERRTSPVGRFSAGVSWCGAFDLAGNVAEWCADWYEEDYYGLSPVEDPPGPETGTSRVLRGGSYHLSGDYDWYSARRDDRPPTDLAPTTGFRVAYAP